MDMNMDMVQRVKIDRQTMRGGGDEAGCRGLLRCGFREVESGVSAISGNPN